VSDATRRRRSVRRSGREPLAAIGAALVVLAVAILTPGCGPQSSDPTEPIPTPAVTTSPVVTNGPVPTPGCGNGIVDDGELCDGEAFCVECRFAGTAGSACCQFFLPDASTGCVDVGLAGAQPCVQNAPGGNFIPGSACSGDPCDDSGSGCIRGQCEIETFAPVSLCCQHTADRCSASIVDNSANLSSFLFFTCNDTGEETAVVGTCGADGSCVPRR
jgi:hypothetical protein